MANLHKQEIIEAVAPLVGDLGPAGYITTTSGGNAGGTTFITTQLDNYGADDIRNLWALIIGGAHAGKYREIDDFAGATPSTSTLKGAALGSAIATGITIELFKYCPAWYTIAINKAIESCYPWLFVGVRDNSITLTAGDYFYTLPTGITPEMVTKVMIEGEGDFDNKPVYPRDDFTFSPDGTEIEFNQKELLSGRLYTFETNKILYIYAQKYLTELAADTTLGTLASFTTATVELTKTTRAWRLFLLYCKAEMLSLLAGITESTDRAKHAQQAQEAWADVERQRSSLKMIPLPTTYT